MSEIAHLNELASQSNDVNLLANKAGRPIALWVPSTQLDCLQLPELTAPRNKWDELIPWQLEDSLLLKPEMYNIIWHDSLLKNTDASTNVNQTSLDVLMVPKAELNKWQLMLDSLDVKATMMVPDCFALPVNDQGWTAYVEGDQVLVRSAQGQGFSCELDFFWQLLERQLDDDETFSVWLWSSKKLKLPEAIEGDERIQLEMREIYWQTLDPPSEYNLLKNSRSTAQLHDAYQPWRLTAVLAAIVLSLLLVWGISAINHYRSATALLAPVVQSDYLKLFGHKLNDPELAKEHGMKQLQALDVQMRLFQSGTISFMREIDSLLSRCQQCEVKSVKADNQELRIELFSPNNLQASFAVLNNRYDLEWSLSEADDDYQQQTLIMRAKDNTISELNR